MSEIQSGEKQEISEKLEIELEDEQQIEQQIEQVVSRVIRSEFSGPIPPPSIIQGYEEVLPGSADRILGMAEKQSSHRQELETMMVKAESRDSLLGVVFAFALGFSCIIAGVVIVILVPKNSGAISASILGMTGIGSIIATFLKSTRGNYTKGSIDKKSDQVSE
ncbi:DUF2335 domain-containing protein [Faecalicatena contorta]|uniref:Uncharacterized membrane protein n=1 Tax=Faecalicatena contorta TaxID=39482 RepID=A0A315ZUU6_9FIRM|nr:DUF2335 domain-containing protein [Faecalicatena contorta]PWJ49371.1 putative membrane protein [Faecalicatena contorta]SUQ14615.1 Uncharacterized membrane protein [Faecalicatena contorta]